MNISIPKDSEVTLSHTFMWASPIPHMIHNQKGPRSNIKIAGVISERLFHG